MKVGGEDGALTINESDGALSIPASIFEGKTDGASVVITFTLSYKNFGDQVVSKAVQITVTVTEMV